MTHTLRFEELDHTADTGIRAYGNTQAELFVNAAAGMMSLIYKGMVDVNQGSTVDMRVESEGTDTLLREWLGELLFLHSVKHVYPYSFKVITCSPTEFHVSVFCLPMSPYMKAAATELKAVTWHCLSVVETEGRFEATVIFDT